MCAKKVGNREQREPDTKNEGRKTAVMNLKNLERQQLRMDKNLARIRKARTLPPALIRERYRAHWRELVADTFDAADKLKDLYLFGGFSISPDNLPKMAAFLDRFSRTANCRQIKRRIMRAILAGDPRGVYTELIGLRRIMRDFFEPLHVPESPAFRAKTG